MTNEKLSNIDLLSTDGLRAAKKDLENFVDQVDSRHNNRRIKLHWAYVYIKFCRRLQRFVLESYCSLFIYLNLSFGLR